MNPFNTLGLEENASPTEVKAAYKELARKLHPDVGGDMEAFIKLKEAYNEALKESQEPKYCLKCMGTGYNLQQSGFNMVNIICPACGGGGKR